MCWVKPDMTTPLTKGKQLKAFLQNVCIWPHLISPEQRTSKELGHASPPNVVSACKQIITATLRLGIGMPTFEWLLGVSSTYKLIAPYHKPTGEIQRHTRTPNNTTEMGNNNYREILWYFTITSRKCEVSKYGSRKGQQAAYHCWSSHSDFRGTVKTQISFESEYETHAHRRA